MSLKTFILGHKRYCVTDKKGCVDKCFTDKGEAVRYKKGNCDCDLQKQVQRKPFSCEKSHCGKDAKEDESKKE